MGKKRIVIVGFGDTGMLTGILLSKLNRHYDIVGISPKPCLVSGQELGTRLTEPEKWKQNYLMDFARYPHLDNVTIIQGTVESIDTAAQQVTLSTATDETKTLPYDALILSTGVTNGFWRNNRLEDKSAIESQLGATAKTVAAAKTLAIIGGGATGVSCATNIARCYPEKTVNLYFSQAQPLPGYHPKTRATVTERLEAAGIQLHPNHRAVIPEGFNGESITHDPIQWSTGQSPSHADAVLWAVGRVIPNTQNLPQSMLTDDGFIRADEYLRVPGYDNIFTVGDVTASDPHRSSARNWGFKLIARNVDAFLQGKPHKLKKYQAAPYRWGSVVGVQQDGLTVFQPNGGHFRFAPWSINTILFPYFVHKMIYKGVRARP